jgi:rhamnosyltransferase
MLSISVALTTFNGERFLKEQLDSLADQSTKPDELVAIDDGSSDGTVDILMTFAQNAYFPVRVILNQNRLGYRMNFMKAAAACACELIAFCDQDDIWARDKLLLMQQSFDDPNVLLTFHNSTFIDEGGSRIGTLFSRREAIYAPLTIPPWTIVPGHTQLVRRSLLRFTRLHSFSIDPYDPDWPMPHDQWFLFWASVLGKIVYLPQCLAQYRLHGTNASGWPYINRYAYVRHHLANAITYVHGEACAAENRLKLLQNCPALLTSEEPAKVDDAIAYCERLRDRSAMRCDVYDSKTLIGRIRALVTLIMRGDYIGRSAGTLGLQALLLDVFIAVLKQWRR